MSAVSKAKEALLRALDQLEEAEKDLGSEPDRVDLCVVYSMGVDSDGEGAYHEVGGWASTGGPQWVHAAMLRRAADEQDFRARQPDDEDEDD